MFLQVSACKPRTDSYDYCSDIKHSKQLWSPAVKGETPYGEQQRGFILKMSCLDVFLSRGLVIGCAVKWDALAACDKRLSDRRLLHISHVYRLLDPATCVESAVSTRFHERELEEISAFLHLFTKPNALSLHTESQRENENGRPRIQTR